ncbi:hypothetical protein AB9K34_00070 [Sedimentitalea sp. XS_ASV28]|uniref:hypothetical protein n=1 Tax=Sedimentitalea sp. XS_ASV28 TaxID=3241296 RepID=UPI00351939CF
MSEEDGKGVHAFRITPELLEKLERERGPDLEYMLRDAHRPFHDPRKVYRIELADPALRIAPTAAAPCA